GDAWAMLLTMAGAAAGFKLTAALTTSIAVCLSVLTSARATRSAALAGSSAEVAVLKTLNAGLAMAFSPAPTLTAMVNATATVRYIVYFNDFIDFWWSFKPL